MTPQQFKRIRERLELTQTELGKMLGYGWRHIHNFEHGHTKIRDDTALAMQTLDNMHKGAKLLERHK